MSTLPSDTPRLPKWPFLVGDAALLGVALLVATRSPLPYPAPVILVIAGCVALAALLGVIPFLTDYAGRQDEALDERQRSLEALTRTLGDAAEQISVAANGLHELSDLAQKQLHVAEALPGKLQERMRAFDRQLNEAAMAENETLRQEIGALRDAEIDRLQTAGDGIRQAIGDLAKTEAAATQQLASAQAVLAGLPAVLAKARDDALQVLAPAQAEAMQSIAKATPVMPAIPPPTPAPIATPPPSPVQAEVVVSEPEPPAPAPAGEPEPPPAETSPVPPPAESASVPAPDAGTAKPVRKPKAPRKPPVAAEQELDLPGAPGEPVSSANVDHDPERDEPTSALTTDGATRLLVTAYIGIGNRLFIRGDAPGLSADKGVPLQFVSIGKWRWETNEAAAPVHLRLYKNDEVECSALGEITVAPGHQTEVSARF